MVESFEATYDRCLFVFFAESIFQEKIDYKIRTNVRFLSNFDFLISTCHYNLVRRCHWYIGVAKTASSMQEVVHKSAKDRRRVSWNNACSIVIAFLNCSDRIEKLKNTKSLNNIFNLSQFWTPISWSKIINSPNFSERIFRFTKELFEAI